MISVGRLAVSCVFLCLIVSPARAQQLSLADLQSKLVGSWIATVEGEKRNRTAVINAISQKSDGVFSFTGTFNFSDIQPIPIRSGEISQSASGLTIVITTGTNAVFTASAKSDGLYEGTTKYAGGQVKPFKLEKSAVAAAPAGPQYLGKAEAQELIGGKQILLRPFANKHEIWWTLASGGNLSGHNTTTGNRAAGTWSINDTGQLCRHWTGANSGDCFFVVRLRGKLGFLSADRKPYGEILETK